MNQLSTKTIVIRSLGWFLAVAVFLTVIISLGKVLVVTTILVILTVGFLYMIIRMIQYNDSPDEYN